MPQDCKEFEGEYLSWLLPSAKNNNNILIIYSDDGANDRYRLQAKEKQKTHRRHIIIHLSDESYSASNELYYKANKVIRSYFFPRLKNVYTIPLGYQSGYAKRVESLEREFRWAFVGQIKNHRQKMLDELMAIPAHIIHTTEKWMDPKALSAEQVKNIYARTLFVPCPFGNINPDTFRVMEALESGSIPVVTKFIGFDYFKYVYGDHPFIVGRNWKVCADKMRLLIEDPKKLEIKQKQVQLWYGEFKANLKRDIFALINEQNPNVISKQFEYQRKAGYLSYLAFILYFKTPSRRTLNRLFHA